MSHQRFKIRKILFRDYTSFILFLFLFAAGFAGPLALVLWPVIIILLWRRIRFINRVLTTGHRGKGLITKKKFFSGEWKVEYSHTVDGKAFTSRNFVLGFSLPFEVGDEVDVFFDFSKPTQAFLPELYR